MWTKGQGEYRTICGCEYGCSGGILMLRSNTDPAEEKYRFRRNLAPRIAFSANAHPHLLFFLIVHEDPIRHFHGGAAAAAANIVKKRGTYRHAGRIGGGKHPFARRADRAIASSCSGRGLGAAGFGKRHGKQDSTEPPAGSESPAQCLVYPIPMRWERLDGRLHLRNRPLISTKPCSTGRVRMALFD
jgi:hypothetical protein